MSFHTECLSKAGGRKVNEDALGFLTLDDGACWVVADGLGGHQGGEVASKLAVETILASFQRNRALSPEALESHLCAAHRAIIERQREDPQVNGARTTAVVLISDYEFCLWAHVGDSRLYCFQGGRLGFQTKDHSVPQVMADAGDLA